MNRCLSRRALSTLLAAGSLGLLGASLGAPARAQVVRLFPASALRGDLQLIAFPEARLNGRPARLAPGARIRGLDNLTRLPATVPADETLPVLYTLDPEGLLLDVWLLRPDEAAKSWPRSREEAQALRFDPAAQSWSRP